MKIMVFETIYSLYEKEVVNEIKKLKTDEEIKFIERKGIIRDIVLKRLAKALSVAVYRNGKIEDVHAGECEGEDYFRGIPDSCMKAIKNFYTIISLIVLMILRPFSPGEWFGSVAIAGLFVIWVDTIQKVWKANNKLTLEQEKVRYAVVMLGQYRTEKSAKYRRV